MYEDYLLLSNGFKNVVRGGQVIGFQVKVRNSGVRGMPLSLFDVSCEVDGELFSADQMTLTVNDRTFTVAQAQQATDVRWEFAAPVTITIVKPGGLAPGLHKVTTGTGARPTNWNPRGQNPDHLYDFVNGPGGGGLTRTTKNMTLV